jgi:hypothetical protein
MSMAEPSTAFSTGLPTGPLEARHLQSRIYRNATETARLTSTHWHIAWVNGLGWGFDGMDGAILALVAPLLMKEFAISAPIEAAFRSRCSSASWDFTCGRGSPTSSGGGMC